MFKNYKYFSLYTIIFSLNDFLDYLFLFPGDALLLIFFKLYFLFILMIYFNL